MLIKGWRGPDIPARSHEVKEAAMSRIQKRRGGHNLLQQRVKWELQKDQIQFFFSLGLLVVLLGFGTCTIIFSFPLAIQVSALTGIALTVRSIVSSVMGRH